MVPPGCFSGRLNLPSGNKAASHDRRLHPPGVGPMRTLGLLHLNAQTASARMQWRTAAPCRGARLLEARRYRPSGGPNLPLRHRGRPFASSRVSDCRVKVVLFRNLQRKHASCQCNGPFKSDSALRRFHPANKGARGRSPMPGWWWGWGRGSGQDRQVRFITPGRRRPSSRGP